MSETKVCPICQTTGCGFDECGLRMEIEWLTENCKRHHCGMDAAMAVDTLADLTTLHPASEWTEADGRVIWWADCPGGDPIPCEMARGSDAFCGRAATERFDFWSCIPKVEIPG